MHQAMRKFLFYLLLLALGICIAAVLAWTNKKTILTHFLSKQLHTAVTIQSFDVSKTGADIDQIWVGNPPPSKTPTAFSARSFSVAATMDEILESPLTIESIDISDIFVGIELYGKGKEDSNWSHILQTNHKESKSSRPYLIRNLTLRNLTVEMTTADGKTKRYPTIKKIEFHNISNETGFPLEEIQKAIFKLMLQDLFKQLNLDQLIQGLFPNVPVQAPLKLLPNLFH
jgi:hypothetical protein